MLNVTVLTGGSTPERNVALAGAAGVVAALRGRGHAVTVVDLATGLISPDREISFLDPSIAYAIPTADQLAALKRTEDWFGLLRSPALQEADVVFPVVHGREVEGGQLQAALDLAGIQYVGSDMRGSLLAMDKEVSKQIFRCFGIPTADWVKWPAPPSVIGTLGLPLIVKPCAGGSTIGLSIVHDPAELDAALDRALAVDSEVIIERFIAGRELSVGVVGQDALAVGEIIPEHEIFDYECKYVPGMSREFFPAQLPEETSKRVQELAVRAHHALKLRHFSRVDFRLGADGECYCLEANTLPGVTPTSLLPQSARAAGLSFDELCDRVCKMALEGGNKAGPFR